MNFVREILSVIFFGHPAFSFDFGHNLNNSAGAAGKATLQPGELYEQVDDIHKLIIIIVPSVYG